MLPTRLPFGFRCLSRSSIIRGTSAAKGTEADEQDETTKGLFKRILNGDGSPQQSDTTLLADQKYIYEMSTHRINSGESRNYLKL